MVFSFAGSTAAKYSLTELNLGSSFISDSSCKCDQRICMAAAHFG